MSHNPLQIIESWLGDFSFDMSLEYAFCSFEIVESAFASCYNGGNIGGYVDDLRDWLGDID